MAESLYGMEIPEGLQELAGRHQANLADLANRMRAIGLDEHAIETAVDELIVIYRDQLIEAVKALRSHNA